MKTPRQCRGLTLSLAPCPLYADDSGFCPVHRERREREGVLPSVPPVKDESAVVEVPQRRAEDHGAAPVDRRRPDWDEYFLALVTTVALRADCTRAHHGAVVVDAQRRIVSTGYNGAPSGMPGCLTAGACPRGRLTYEELQSLSGGYDDPASPGYCNAVHAEANALLYAGRSRAEGATIYITGAPCHGCEKLIRASGVARIVYRDKNGNTVSVDPRP